MNEQVPKEIQLYCWKLIDKQEAETEWYYLLIFEFNWNDQHQAIAGLQIDKLWVNDDSVYQTMLLPEDYWLLFF